MISKQLGIRQMWKYFVSSLSIVAVIELQTSAIAQERSQVINSAPRAVSICRALNPNIANIPYGKLARVQNEQNFEEAVVFDRNYKDPLAQFLNGLTDQNQRNRKLFFTAWFADNILFNVYREEPRLKTWTMVRGYGESFEYGTGEEFSYYLRVNQSRYAIAAKAAEEQCIYGVESLLWKSGHPIALVLSDEAKQALSTSTQADKIAIGYTHQAGNTSTETEFDIGYGTVEGWRRLDEIGARKSPNRLLSRGMPYVEARQLLINAGWKPIEGEGEIDHRTASRASAEHFEDFLEVQGCSGTGRAMCAFKFANADGSKNLRISTAGMYRESLSIYDWKVEPIDENDR